MAHIIKSTNFSNCDAADVTSRSRAHGSESIINSDIAYEAHVDIVSELSNVNEALQEKIQEKDCLINELKTKVTTFENDLSEIKESIYEKYRGKGKKAGIQDAKDSVSEKLEYINSITESIISTIENKYKEVELDLIDIVYASVLKLTGQCLTSDIVHYELNKIIKDFANSVSVQIFVSTLDFELLNKSDHFSSSNIEFIIDEKILPGGFVVESESESIDARLDKKLELFKEQIRNF